MAFKASYEHKDGIYIYIDYTITRQKLSIEKALHFLQKNSTHTMDGWRQFWTIPFISNANSQVVEDQTFSRIRMGHNADIYVGYYNPTPLGPCRPKPSKQYSINWCHSIFKAISPYFSERLTPITSLTLCLEDNVVKSPGAAESRIYKKTWDGEIRINYTAVKSTIHLTSLFLHELSHILTQCKGEDVCGPNRTNGGHTVEWWIMNASLVTLLQNIMPDSCMQYVDVAQLE